MALFLQKKQTRTIDGKKMLSVRANATSLKAASANHEASRCVDRGLERLSTGKRINNARDDVAGVAIGTRILKSISGLQQNIKNALDCQSILDVADGHLSEIGNALQRLRQLAIQASNDTNSDLDRNSLQEEANSIIYLIDAIAKSSNWAGEKLLDGTFNRKNFMIGVDSDTLDFLEVSITGATSHFLGLSVATQSHSASTGSVPSSENNNTSTPSSNTEATLNNAATYNWPSINTSNNTGTIYGNNYSITSNKQISHTPNAGWQLFPQEFNISPGINAVRASEVQTYNISFERPTKDIYIAFESIGSSGALGKSVPIQFNFDVDIRWALDQNGWSVTQTGNKSIVGIEGFAIIAVPDGLDSVQVEFQRAENYTRMYIGGSEPPIADSDVGNGDNSLTGQPSENGNPSPETSLDRRTIDITSSASSRSSLGLIDAALSNISGQRAILGAMSNRLELSISNATNICLNMGISLGRIVDTDYAAETIEYAKNQVLQMASMEVLSQAIGSKISISEFVKGLAGSRSR